MAVDQRRARAGPWDPDILADSDSCLGDDTRQRHQSTRTVEQIVGVMRAAGDGRHGCRLRGLIVVLWRAGLRIHEALALNESDLDHRRGAVLVRRGKGGRRREVGMDEWAWEQLQPWLDLRVALQVGPPFCVITGPTRGRTWGSPRSTSKASTTPRSSKPSTPATRQWCRSVPRSGSKDAHGYAAHRAME